MHFSEIENLIVNDNNSFQLFIDYFTKTSPEERELYYYEKSQINNISKAEYKNILLQSKLTDFIKNKLQISFNKVKLGADKEALEEISFLSLLEPIFKEHDIHTSNSFVSSIDPKISEFEVGLLKTKHMLSDQEVTIFSDKLIKIISEKPQSVKTIDEYRDRLLANPMLQCLNSHTNSKALIQNIENGIIELGYYKDLIVSVLQAGLDLSKESLQRFIFFIINEDIKNNGLFNVLQNDNYEPVDFKDFIENIVSGKKINPYDLHKLINTVEQNHTKYIKYQNNEIKELISSKHSLTDSLFYCDFLNLFVHIHTAQNSGNNQNHQHINSGVLLHNEGYNTIGITVMEKSIVEKVNFANSYLNIYSENIHLNHKEIAWMTALQIDAKHIQHISNSRVKNDPFKDKILANCLTFVEKQPYLDLSIELNKIRSEKTDFENIVEDKEFLFSIIKKNMDLMNDIFSDTVSENSKLFQHWTDPILTKVEAYLKFEKKFKKKLLTDEEIQTLNKIFDNKINNVDLNNKIDEIQDKIENRNHNINEYTSLKKNSLEEWNNKDFIQTNNHLTAIQNFEEDIISYFYNNPYIKENFSETEKQEHLKALRNRIVHEWGGSYSYVDTQEKKLLNLFDTLVNGNSVYSSIGYYNYSKDNDKQMLARTARAPATSNNSNIVLNLLAIAAHISGTRLYCYNTNYNEKIRVKLK